MEYKRKDSKHRILTVSNNIFFAEVEKYLLEGKNVLFNIAGNSMRPFLYHGDQVLLKPFELTDLKKGRIALVKTEAGFILHRIVKVQKDIIKLAGDANLVQLETVAIPNVMAIVIDVVKGKNEGSPNTFVKLFLALLWYRLRPLRLLAYKLF